jgi:hypothetical protein
MYFTRWAEAIVRKHIKQARFSSNSSPKNDLSNLCTRSYRNSLSRWQ